MCLKVIFPIVNISALFTLKLDFKVNSFVFSKVTFDKIQVTDIALFCFMDFCHVLSQDIYAVLKVFSQLVHFDSFFLWYCLKCLWKRGKVPKSFPHSGHSMSFWMFMVQRFCPNWKKNPQNITFNFAEACGLCLMQNLSAIFYHFAVF